MQDVTLEDGDIARLLIRTADMLRQVMHNDALLPDLRETAKIAFKGMDRKPVADMVK